MKRNRIISMLLAFFLMFPLIELFAQPAYAIKASELGISVSTPVRTYYNDKGTYGMKITLKNNGNTVLTMSAYLCNADGKCVATWDSCELDPKETKTKNFTANYNKYPSSSYTFVLKVRANYLIYNSSSGSYEYPVFKWKWTVTKAEACGPYLAFKAATFQTLDSGTVVPRINIRCVNLKGQNVTLYIYDANGDLVYKRAGNSALKSNDVVRYFTWGGKSEYGQQPDGTYTVKVVATSGQTISKKFYLDFPYNNK